MKKQLTEQELSCFKAFSEIAADLEFNDYVRTCVALGRKRPGECASFEEFMREAGYEYTAGMRKPEVMPGFMEENSELIKNRDVNEFYRRTFFNFAMSVVFDTAPKIKEDFGEDYMFLFFDDMRNYINECFPLFCEIAETEAEYDAFDLMTEQPYSDIKPQNNISAKLLSDIYLKKFKKGKDVSKYLKKAKLIPEYVRKLLVHENNRYTLKIDDVHGIDYKLAVFSTLNFITGDNYSLWLLKCAQWQKSQAVKGE